MARVAATTVKKRTVAVASLHSTNDADYNMREGISRTPFVDPLKGKSTPTLKTKHRPPFCDVEDY